MCVTNIIKNLTCFQGVFVIKNYRLTLINLLVSCSLLNAMEDVKSKVKEKETTVSEDIVRHLRSTYRPTCRQAKIEPDKPIFNRDNHAILKYTSNIFNMERDKFVKSVIKTSCKDDSSKYLPPNPLTEKDYKDIQGKLKVYFQRCKNTYRDNLFRMWTNAKTTDYKKFIKTIMNIEFSNSSPNQKVIKYVQVNNCSGCINGVNGLAHHYVILPEEPYSDGSDQFYGITMGIPCSNTKLIKTMKKYNYNPTEDITKEKIRRKYPIGEEVTQFAMYMWEWEPRYK